MRFFFRSRQFKIFLAVTAGIIALSILLTVLGSYISPQASIGEAIVMPFKSLAATIKNSADDFSKRLSKSDEILQENKQLQEEINSLRQQLVDYEIAINDNEFYKDFLEIKENNPDFKFCPAFVTGVDPEDVFGGFTLDKGTLDGVELYDPVITDAGLVGFVTELGFSTSKVTTILSPELICGAYSSRTNDAGVISGTREFALKGETRLYNLSRTCTVAVGDIIITSGSGIFPDRLVVGTVSNIQSDPLTSSLYAIIEPAVRFDELKNVMVLTSFEGQGDALPSGE
ncbi:MAG: rod shape-determining protein MreC [Clostridia bacterium]|nr:rod shape-determining protein MreC [Clostridia bacterium]